MTTLSKIMRHLTLIALLAITLPAFSQNISDSSVGKVALQLIAALNTGSPEKQRDFITAHIDPRASRSSNEEWAQQLADLYRQTDGVELVEMKQGRDPDEAHLILKPKNNTPVIEMFTHLSRESTHQVIGFILRPTGKSASPMPQKVLSDVDIAKEIEQRVAKAVSEDRFSGAILVTKNNQMLIGTAYGFADQEKKISNSPNTKFNVGSMNKMFTGVAIAQLVQAGKLSFNDSLAKVLPDYPNKAIAKKITVAQLLTHTSGLGDFFTPAFFDKREQYVDLPSYLPLFANQALQFEPGTDWAYSNAGFIVLGVIIEKMSGENYFDYVRKHIFKPAGMTDTDFFERNLITPSMAIGYTRDENGGAQSPRRPNTAMLPVKGSSAGGGYSTTQDLLSFRNALLENRLLSAAMTKMVLTGKLDDHHPDSKYAYGFMDVTKAGKHMVGHNGGGPGINGSMNMLDNGYTVIALGNYDPPAADVLVRDLSELLIRQ